MGKAVKDVSDGGVPLSKLPRVPMGGPDLDGDPGPDSNPDGGRGGQTAAERAADTEARDDQTLAESRAGSVIADSLAFFRRRASGEDRPVPLPDGWTVTTAALKGGLWAGCYMLIAGTGAGKSQWCFNVGEAAVSAGVPMHYAGLELDHPGMVARLAAIRLARSGVLDCRIQWSDIYLGRSDVLDTRAGIEAVNALAASPLYLSTAEARGGAGGYAYTQIERDAAAMRRAHPKGPILMVVDFLQIVAANPLKPREDLRERIGGAAYAARMAARRYGVSVVLVSGTARSAYSLFQGEKSSDVVGIPLGDGDPSRFVGTGKESGETEYAADGVLALGRAKWPKGTPAPPVWLAVAKARTGHAADSWASYTFDGTLFTERPREIEPVKPSGNGGRGKGGPVFND